MARTDSEHTGGYLGRRHSSNNILEPASETADYEGPQSLIKIWSGKWTRKGTSWKAWKEVVYTLCSLIKASLSAAHLRPRAYC